MLDLISLAFSVAFYVLQAIGLQTLADRRGIRFAWLAWVPFGALWVLGAIADDYKLRMFGKRWVTRTVLPLLMVALLVMSFLLVGLCYTKILEPLSEIVSYEEILNIYAAAMDTDSVSHMYEPVAEDAIADLAKKLEANLTDDIVAGMERSLPLILLLTVGVCVSSIAGMVLEFVCWYQLYASCDPVNKGLYLVISLVFNVQALFVFILRNKDLGFLPPDNALPEAPNDYWQQN